MINNALDKKVLVELYSSGKSMVEISKIMNCSAHKVVYWMTKYGISRRNRSEATYIKRNPNGDPFKIKKILSPDEHYLLGLSLGIYWGEGLKLNPHNTKVANTDPNLLKIFIRFLREICQVENQKIRYSIVCFNDSNPEEAKRYWSKELKISPSKFGKIVQIPPQGKGTYKKKSKYGVCSVDVSNIKLKKWIMQQIKSIQ